MPHFRDEFVHGQSHEQSKTTAYDGYRRYVNYGYFEKPEEVSLFHLRLDTWYFAGLEHAGTMPLGVGPITSEAGVTEAVASYLAGFREAFAGLFRLDPESYYFGYHDVLLNSPQFATQLAARLPPRRAINGTNASFEAQVLMRDDKDNIALHSLLGGEIWLFHSTEADRRTRPRAMAEQAATAEWAIELILTIGSLFRADNQQALAHVRAVWKSIRQRYPEVTCFIDVPENEGLDEPLIITLADPPPGTPPDNQKLSALNLPALQSAVARWEQITGRSFEWAKQFKRIGD